MYRVIRRPSATDQMFEIVRRNPALKGEFAAALRALTAVLSTDPTTAGESREPPFRIELFDPITVTFVPNPDAGEVYIAGVHLPD